MQSFSSYEMLSSLTEDRPSPFGLKGERLAKTPMRALPPSLGGRTVRLECGYHAILRAFTSSYVEKVYL